ncbi:MULTISPECIES: alpha/beta fold hydrolase [Streptomycetaceae]|uniref:Putative lipase n=1 Tax=Streptantibioticus cattleyicolor (strain ATCC 35852 / DSM 46488 / JCM 4925 / NBRC 14057 / NRRL 8057) TaxID=1003195 RepID=F8K2U8_STREN|nr:MULTISPECIES: alpha/beta fold hydrolase [Streptomycetaceae]AEW95570.1 putative lipase [Streptantibioticus cattleyicolor NRRL 8057 = DSM 46488]MYS60121.1 alpha/beta fold hydrolase [Streptomyces sp. SID5468]CCB75907.1 putative lipase [Streptantibioticus cattleyicolor NRRL 8057 = DSM 46488]
MSLLNPKIPGLNSEDLVKDITESPHRLHSVAQAGWAGFISTVDVDGGADDWDKPLPKEHPRPVVLVHGTFGNRGYTWTSATPLLRQNGYRVFRLDYGQYNNPVIFGLGDIKKSAKQLAEFVDEVLRRTGAEQVDMVGFSQGGMMPRYYLNALGGGPKVRNFIGISPSNHGITAQGLMNLARQIPGAKELVEQGAVGTVIPAWPQLQHDHAFQKALADLGETTDGVRYTVIATQYDDVVTPYTSCALNGGDGHYVKNIVLQDIDPNDHTPHVSMPYNQTVLKEVLKALAS